ncbi:MAG: lasso RiPP family leader peptide-containing protein [Planctomycetota bacterium]
MNVSMEQPTKPCVKKPYAAPRLVVHGSVEKITGFIDRTKRGIGGAGQPSFQYS